jgi:hypothetical protein
MDVLVRGRRRGYSGRFKADDFRGPEWAECGQIPDVLEGAEVSKVQGQCMLLFCKGWAVAMIARQMEMRWENVSHAVDQCIGRIKAADPELGTAQRRWAKAIIQCYRNRQVGGAPVCFVYDERGTPVVIRAKIVIPEDLTRTDPSFFSAFKARLLATEES